MTRAFLQPDELRDLVAAQFGANRRLTALDRLTGGSKKGVYRLNARRPDNRNPVRVGGQRKLLATVADRPG